MSESISQSFAATYISLAADLTQKVRVGRRAGGNVTGVVGEVRTYAGGRSRPVLGAGTPGQTPLSIRTTDRAVIATLKSWAGRTVLVRDSLGRGEFGVFFEVPETDLGTRWVDVDLTIRHVTGSVEV